MSWLACFVSSAVDGVLCRDNVLEVNNGLLTSPATVAYEVSWQRRCGRQTLAGKPSFTAHTLNITIRRESQAVTAPAGTAHVILACSYTQRQIWSETWPFIAAYRSKSRDAHKPASLPESNLTPKNSEYWGSVCLRMWSFHPHKNIWNDPKTPTTFQIVRRTSSLQESRGTLWTGLYSRKVFVWKLRSVNAKKSSIRETIKRSWEDGRASEGAAIAGSIANSLLQGLVKDFNHRP